MAAALRLLAAVLTPAITGTSDMTLDHLRCEYMTNPLGIDVTPPRLSWTLTSNQRGQIQTAYQILVATSPDLLAKDRADLWDSGKVASKESLNIAYAGKPLSSGIRAYWKVRARDRHGNSSPYSAPAWWEMALLAEQDWRAKWIARNDPPITRPEQYYADRPAPLLRKEINVDKKVARARAYVSGLGYYELRINGQKVGDHLLDPAWTSYAKRVLYATYDVTDLLRQARTAIGIMLGNGWYNPLPMRMWGRYNLRDHLTVGTPRAILQLQIDYTDGTRQTVVTDETWKASDGPILRDNAYLGEHYDARREQPGWDRPGFDDASWPNAVTSAEPIGPLHAQMIPPIKAMRTVKTVNLTEPKPGLYIFDLGQNLAGRVRLRVQGPAGATVTLRYGELLYTDGTLNGMTSVAGQIKKAGMAGPGAPDVAFQQDAYTLKGQGLEEYAPRFTFHGFRYVEVAGYPGKPTPDAIEGELLHSAVEPAGAFSCSNELYNRIQDMVVWTQRSNMFSVQSDCPHREKFGYGGDIVSSSEMAILNLDMTRFYAKAVQDFSDAVRPNGGITETAPFVGIAGGGLGEGVGPIGWGAAHPLLLWQRYQYYGDKHLIEQQYETSKRWGELLRANAKDHVPPFGIGDHESIAPKPVALTSTAFYYLNAHLLAKLAAVIGKPNDATRYAKLADDIRQAFNAKFLKPGTGVYDSGTQACQAFALYMGLVPENEEAAALDVLVKDVLDKSKGHLTTGIFGTKYMLLALSDLGRADVAHTIASQKTFPGWGHMLDRGATTLWEHWAFSDNTFSHNHPMFGSVSEWFYKHLAGISPAEDAVGFDKIIIRPHLVADLKWVKAHHDSVRGRIRSEWRIENQTFELNVTIPPGATATVYIPALDKQGVTEGSSPADRAEGVEFLRMDGGAAVYRIGSGSYQFVSRRPRRG
ncbi:MAG: family 78 glycoside hydrolase catalytic domain [Phycisphaerae bacterium]|nr:family 78 glycoside hydrolase catalytic domain [Phycisphaerae bacterium]